ncbi:hypothetical protein FRX31_034509 [Thalictrum thalictroides]|uniref:Uncharacterized protein n=1 Tax=Thalictrum thalictroides TaxID=46969 RepID=A0A7J6UTH4_THATH|nr:hypothetical protein FRX31_034509 [Thalictrum thalictroides]
MLSDEELLSPGHWHENTTYMLVIQYNLKFMHSVEACLRSVQYNGIRPAGEDLRHTNSQIKDRSVPFQSQL